uniref:Uncharacterized protein n=1 Tax=Oryza punctata TaxID=4537 RepID=A0A0E0KWX0_ORYPU
MGKKKKKSSAPQPRGSNSSMLHAINTMTLRRATPREPASTKQSKKKNGAIPRKRFRLCVRGPAGTRAAQDGDRLTTTSLGREVWLRWHMLIFDQTFYAMDGFRTWDAYAHHLPDIAATIRGYRERRVERGLFHLRPLRDLLLFHLMFPSLRHAPPRRPQKVEVSVSQEKRGQAAAGGQQIRE